LNPNNPGPWFASLYSTVVCGLWVFYEIFEEYINLLGQTKTVGPEDFSRRKCSAIVAFFLSRFSVLPGLLQALRRNKFALSLKEVEFNS
jgi:hypothetical protein